MSTSNKLRRPYRKLTDICVDEISVVRDGAARGAKIMLRKRAPRDALTEATKHLAMSVKSIAEDPNCDKNAMLTKTFAQFQDHLRKVIKNNAERSEPDLSDSAAGTPDRRRRRREGEAARLAAEMDTDADRDHDDDTFLAGDTGENGSGSVDQLERARRAMKMENNMQTHNELMSDVVKQYGIAAFCKSVENGDVRVSEHRLTELISEAAQRENSTFEKLFCAQDEQGVTLRKAIMDGSRMSVTGFS
jgi:hypothetical protein